MGPQLIKNLSVILAMFPIESKLAKKLASLVHSGNKIKLLQAIFQPFFKNASALQDRRCGPCLPESQVHSYGACVKNSKFMNC